MFIFESWVRSSVSSTFSFPNNKFTNSSLGRAFKSLSLSSFFFLFLTPRIFSIFPVFTFGILFDSFSIGLSLLYIFKYIILSWHALPGYLRCLGMLLIFVVYYVSLCDSNTLLLSFKLLLKEFRYIEFAPRGLNSKPSTLRLFDFNMNFEVFFFLSLIKRLFFFIWLELFKCHTLDFFKWYLIRNLAFLTIASYCLACRSISSRCLYWNDKFTLIEWLWLEMK